MKKSNKKVSFSQFGNYNILFKYFIENGLCAEYVSPPEITKRTMELGNKYSPDYVCSPFKFTLGCFIEAIEAGADTIVQVGGIVACRLKYYGELQSEILRDIGYDITFVNLGKANRENPKSFLTLFKQINPDFSLIRILKTGVTVLDMLLKLDDVQAYVSRNVGFEVNKGDYDKVFKNFINGLKNCKNNVFAVNSLYKKTMKKMAAIPVSKPEKPLRIALIGEYYTVMDDFSSHNIERKMAEYGMVIDRWLNISNTVIRYKAKPLRAMTKAYVKYDMGVTTTSNISFALDCAKKGYDGIIQLKSFGCTPEIDDMPVLRNISADYNIPILFFSFDCQNADTGIETRLEAFNDMIKLKNQAADRRGKIKE